MPSYTPMLTATQARARSSNDRIIFDEIRNIESAALDAIDSGQYDVVVSDGTTMTNNGSGIALARLYYSTWTAADSDRARDAQMNAVINYFAALGYSIERRANPSTNDTFLWYMAW